MSIVPYSPNGTLSTGIALVAQLEQTGAITDQGLNPDIFDATYDQCEALAALCGKINDITSWVLGDLVAYTERRFGEVAPQLMLASGRSERTLLNTGSVSRRVPFERRVNGVTHSHHAEVASLPPKEQTRWLNRAKKEGMTRDELRAHLRSDRQMEPCEHEYVCRHCGQHGP